LVRFLDASTFADLAVFSLEPTEEVLCMATMQGCLQDGDVNPATGTANEYLLVSE
jgi:hypothetical protein